MAAFNQLGKYGRMGNAMFQIAATMGLAQRTGECATFPNWQYRSHFKLNGCRFIGRDVPYEKSYEEPCYAYRPIPRWRNCNIYGYFQSERYFSNCSDLVRQALTPIDSHDRSEYRGVCGVHVRRTDYLIHQGCYTVLGPDYYYKAASMVPAQKFLVFSDDLKWCRENLTDSRFIVKGPAPDYVDFSILMACEHHVIANSSFSWWAAWMNPNPNKMVIAPKNWFGPKLAPTHPTDDLIPAGWVRV